MPRLGLTPEGEKPRFMSFNFPKTRSSKSTCVHAANLRVAETYSTSAALHFAAGVDAGENATSHGPASHNHPRLVKRAARRTQLGALATTRASGWRAEDVVVTVEGGGRLQLTEGAGIVHTALEERLQATLTLSGQRGHVTHLKDMCW